ncbi:MAG: hypothetical protein IJU44_11935 [Kiritimatiellae bacterium]|nr:hypothetical protein [Kiritimatiellia bacterium]
MKTVLGLTVVLAAAVGFAEMESSAPEAQGLSARAVLRCRILLPEMRDTALPADPAADEELNKRSASLTIRPAEQGWTLEIDTPFGLQKLNIVHGCWVDGEIQLEPDNPRDRHTYHCGKQLYDASGAWTNGNHFPTRVFFIAHPGSATFDLVFSPQGTLKADLNYRHIFGFGHTEFSGQ